MGRVIEEIDHLIESLQDAKKFIINNNESQGKFQFESKETVMYNIGDNEVNSENLQTGNVVQIDEENQKVEIAYNNGGTAWVLAENVKKLLLETDPIPRQQFLNE